MTMMAIMMMSVPLMKGGGREEIDKTLVKKIILVVACVLLIAGVCVALMYLI